MEKLLWVMAGGALGSASRYLISELTSRWATLSGVWSTMLINVLGSLLIGISFYFIEKGNLSSSMRLFIMIGVLGGFTTFSAFALDNFTLFKEGETMKAAIYIILSNSLAIGAAFGGYLLIKFFAK